MMFHFSKRSLVVRVGLPIGFVLAACACAESTPRGSAVAPPPASAAPEATGSAPSAHPARVSDSVGPASGSAPLTSSSEKSSLTPFLLNPDDWARQIAPGDSPGPAELWQARPLTTNAGVVLYAWLLGSQGTAHAPCQAVASAGEVVLSCGHEVFRAEGDKLVRLSVTGIPIRKLGTGWLTTDDGMGEEGGPPSFTWAGPPRKSLFAEFLGLADANGAWALVDTSPPPSEDEESAPSKLRAFRFEAIGHPARPALTSWPKEYADCDVVGSWGSDEEVAFYVHCAENTQQMRLSWDGQNLRATEVEPTDEATEESASSHLPSDAPEWARSFEHAGFGEPPASSGTFAALERVVRIGDEYWLNDASGVFSTRKPAFTYAITSATTFEGSDIELVPPLATRKCPRAFTRMVKATPARAHAAWSELKRTYEGREVPVDVAEFFYVSVRGEVWIVRDGENNLSDQRDLPMFCFDPKLLRPVGR